MSAGFLNAVLLAGLAAVSVPIIIHLIHRRRFDVVHWGAMQFLELGQQMRKRMRLEELLLLLLRILLIALIVLALARPFLEGGPLTAFVSTESRDVVFVVDGSGSMGWRGDGRTPQEAAARWIDEFLDYLNAGDTVALIEARDAPRRLIAEPTRDFDVLRGALDGLPEPAGAADMPAAIAAAMQTLGATQNLSREIIVVTDGQRFGWGGDDVVQWQRVTALSQRAAVPPRLWVVTLGNQNQQGEPPAEPRPRPNWTVERIELSRPLTAPGLAVTVRTSLRYTGGVEDDSQTAYVEVDGQRLAGGSGVSPVTVQTADIPPGGEVPIEFYSVRLETLGTHVISVVVDADNLPSDDRADAVIEVIDALPVLLVDGDPSREPFRSETDFLRPALSATENQTPLVAPRVIRPEELSAAELEGRRVVVLANVPRLTDVQLGWLEQFVRAGGGMFVAPGDAVDAEFYNDRLYRDGAGWLPCRLAEVAGDPEANPRGARPLRTTFLHPLVAPFREDAEGGLAEARFVEWWVLEPFRPRGTRGRGDAETRGARSSPPSEGGAAAGENGDDAAAPRVAGTDEPATVIASLQTGDPFLLERRYGLGRVVVMAGPADADWGTLPAKPDYVVLMHELMFYLAGQSSGRNVDAGEPLLRLLDDEHTADAYDFFTPDGRRVPAAVAELSRGRLVRLDDTGLPGIYRLRLTEPSRGPAEESSPLSDQRGSPPSEGGAGGGGAAANDARADATRPGDEHFVVNFDRGESDLAPLDEADREILAGRYPTTFVADFDELARQMLTDASRREIWRWLLVLVIGLLCVETWFTRRMVRRGGE